MKIKSVSKKSVILMEFDWVLFIATICLSVFGIVMIYSATRTLQSNTNVIVQSGAMVIGCAAMLVTCFFDYEQLKNLVKPIYICRRDTAFGIGVWCQRRLGCEELDQIRCNRYSAFGNRKNLLYSNFFVSLIQSA